MSHITFFSGAGTSAGLGLPTMRDLYDMFSNESTFPLDKAVAESADGDLELLFELLTLLTERDGLLSNYNSFLVGMARQDPAFPFSLENPHAFDSRPIPFAYAQWDKIRNDASVARERLINLLSRELTRVVANTSNFLAEFLQRWSENQVPLKWFTTNYDMTLEETAHALSIPFSTGFHDGYWSGEFSERFQIYKLHGSLSWYQDESTLVEREDYGPPTVHRVGKSPLTHVLMYPRRTKRYVEPYLTLIDNFKQVLGVTDVLVSIGYGWRDEEILQVLTQSMKRNRNLRIVLFDTRSSEIAERLNMDPTRVIQCNLPVQAGYSVDVLDYLLLGNQTVLEKLYSASLQGLGRGAAPQAARALASLPNPLSHLKMALLKSKDEDQRWLTLKWVLLEWWRVCQSLPIDCEPFESRKDSLGAWIKLLTLADRPGKIVCCIDTPYYAKYKWSEPLGVFPIATVLEQRGPIHWGGPAHATGSFVQLIQVSGSEPVYIERPIESSILGDPPFLQLDRPNFKKGLL